MSQLDHILRREISSSGPIPFCRFMELALYCPNLGYYERARGQTGRVGDFYTSVSVGPVLGQLLGFQFAYWLEHITECPVHLVESGAHEGNLARDILEWLERYRPALFDRLEYWILESSLTRRGWQQEILRRFSGKLRWFDSIEAVPEGAIRGVIFSNEFLDALPVHRLGWDASTARWFEWGVDRAEETFIWVRLPEISARFQEALGPAELTCPAEVQAVLPDGFTIELNLRAGAWWRAAARRLRQGRLLTLDYGMRGSAWFSPERLGGTVRSYSRHQVSEHVLADPGGQDITAHVNFSFLQNMGEREGLHTVAWERQEQFLTHIFRRAWRVRSEFLVNRSDWQRAFQTLTHPEHLGRALQAFLQMRTQPVPHNEASDKTDAMELE